MNQILTIEKDRLTLHVRVQPRSSKTEWGRVVDREYIQLKIHTPPVDGAANKACLKYIAKEFKTAKSNVTIIRGEKSRKKTIVVTGADSKKLTEFRQKYLDGKESGTTLRQR